MLLNMETSRFIKIKSFYNLEINFCNLAAATLREEYFSVEIGEVTEWLKVHAWKACVRRKRTEGSNPSLSAN